MRRLLSALVVFASLTAGAFADKADEAFWATVEIPSHGLSGTVIHTELGRTLILTAAHGGDYHRTPVVNLPTPAQRGGAPIKARPRWVFWDRQADLALIELEYGPVPVVARIAPKGFQPSGSAWMYGYGGSMQYAREQRPGEKVRASIAGSSDGRFEVRPAPIPGRSGGGLVDRPSGYLIGVCSTRELDRLGRPTGIRGWYVNLETIQRFCDRAWPGGGQLSVMTPDAPRPMTPRPMQPIFQPSCPGGG
jgi:hypothetical protein